MKTFTWFRIHSFTGVMTGLMLFVICWSGTWAVISYELDWLADPASRVQPQGERAGWGEIESAALTAVPGSSLDYVMAPQYDCASMQVWLSQGDEQIVIRINPYTAEVIGRSSAYDIGRFFRGFHTKLFIPNMGGHAVGIYVVGLFAIFLLISLIAALMFYRRWWREFLRWPQGLGRAFWSELHKSAGLWSVWFLLIIGVTGGWYFFEMVQSKFGGSLNYVGDPPTGVKQPRKPDSDESLPRLPLSELIAHARNSWPELEIRTIGWGWYSGDRDVLYLEGETGCPLVRDRANQMHLDGRTGEVLWQNSARDLPPYWVWSNMAVPLHFGYFGGLWSKVIWFAFGLALCGLILTGTYLHARRLGQDSRGRHRWPGTLAAIVVTLLLLAASVPFGLNEVREYYGPIVDGTRELPTLAPGAKVVIFGWIGLTLVSIAWWVRMLWKAGRTGSRHVGSPNA